MESFDVSEVQSMFGSFFLPDELCVLILSNLGFDELTRCSFVSREWRRLSYDDLPWRKVCERMFGSYEWKELETKSFRFREMLSSGGWRRIFLHFFGLHNFIEHELSFLNFLEPQYNVGVSCIQSDSKIVVVGFGDGSMRVLGMGQGADPMERRVKPIKAHTQCLYALRFHENSLFTAGFDKLVKEWNLNREKNTATFVRDIGRGEGHTDVVSCLGVSNMIGYLVTGSWDATAKKFDLKTGRCVTTYYGSEDGLLCVDLNENFVCAGGYDLNVYVWETGGNLVARLVGYFDRPISSVFLDDETVIGASWDGSIRHLDIVKRKMLDSKLNSLIIPHDEYELHTNGKAIQKDHDTLLVCSPASVSIVSTDSGEILKNLTAPFDDETNKNYLTCVHYHSRIIFIGNAFGGVDYWTVKSGRFTLPVWTG